MLLLQALTAGALTSCDKETVHVGFRPEAGASYRYEIKVQSVTTTLLGDEAPDRSVDDVTLESRDTVLSDELQAVEPGEEQPPAAQVGPQEGGRSSGDDADPPVPPGQLPQGLDDTRQRPGLGGVVDDGGEGSVEVREDTRSRRIGPERGQQFGDRQ